MNVQLSPKLLSKRRVVDETFFGCDGQESALSNDIKQW
jgi:hypothetical protein